MVKLSDVCNSPMAPLKGNTEEWKNVNMLRIGEYSVGYKNICGIVLFL
jgi:hypothetical protein